MKKREKKSDCDINVGQRDMCDVNVSPWKRNLIIHSLRLCLLKGVHQMRCSAPRSTTIDTWDSHKH